MMKLTSILNNIISEVGEGTAQPYRFSIDDDQRNHNKNGAYRRVSFHTDRS